jgi:hypothetical protein
MNNINNFIPVNETLIVKPYKERFKKVEQTVLDDEKNKGKDPKKDIMSLKKVTEKVLYNHQRVQVVAAPTDNRLGIVPGDIIVVDWRKNKEFDLFKKMYMFSMYDIIAKEK